MNAPPEIAKDKNLGSKPNRSSAYDKDFELLLIERNVYPRGYRYPETEAIPEPSNLGRIAEALAVRRASLSPSIFPRSAFNDFALANDRVVSEGKVMREILPIIHGNMDIPNESDLAFTNLESMTNGTTVDAVPDFFDGSSEEDVDEAVKQDLKCMIVPIAHHESAPVAPNFFLEAKAPRGGAHVAKRQACLDGAVGARAMQSLLNYGQNDTIYDNNAYTISSTYHAGTGSLHIFTHHVTGPKTDGGRPEYHMTQLRVFSMTDTHDAFLAGATAFRNARILAQQQRDSLIRRANNASIEIRLAEQSDTELCTQISNPWQTLDDDLQQQIAESQVEDYGWDDQVFSENVANSFISQDLDQGMRDAEVENELMSSFMSSSKAVRSRRSRGSQPKRPSKVEKSKKKQCSFAVCDTPYVSQRNLPPSNSQGPTEESCSSRFVSVIAINTSSSRPLMVSAEHFRNEIIQYHVHRQRDNFIEQLRCREAEVLSLAAVRCNKASAQFFRPPGRANHFTRGSYNICFFVRFSEGGMCVVRIPLRPCLAFCPQRKVDAEVATIVHLSENTPIPVPKILAYGAEAGSDPLSTFIILEYVEGRSLSPAEFDGLSQQDKQEFYKSLADMYMHLRRQKFPSIGTLKRDAGGGVRVAYKTASLEMNMQQLEGLDPFRIQDSHYGEDGILKCASSYTNMLLYIGYNSFLKCQSAVGEDMGHDVLYHQSLFQQRVQEWVDSTLDSGPFVMIHGDLHLSNLLVNDKMQIISLLDWEWSRIVPLQYFSPPLWLTCRSTVQLAGPNSWALFLMNEFADFLAVRQSRELAAFGNQMLHDEWKQRTENAEPLIANALENWTEADWFASRYLNRVLADKKEQECLAYTKEVEAFWEPHKHKVKGGETSRLANCIDSGQKLTLGAIGAALLAIAVGAGAIAAWRRK